MLTIIGCGNTNRGDDAAGIHVAQGLQQWLSRNPHAGVQVFDAGTNGMDVMFQARGSKALIIVDACLSDSQPGAVFEVPGEQLAHAPEPAFSLHDFRWDNALYAGRKIFREEFPSDVVVFLIEAADVSLRIGLSESVETAARLVTDRLITRIGGECQPA